MRNSVSHPVPKKEEAGQRKPRRKWTSGEGRELIKTPMEQGERTIEPAPVKGFAMSNALKTADSSTYSTRRRAGTERRCTPDIRCGREYSNRWQMGARTLKELDPAFSDWVEQNEKRKAMRSVALMLATFAAGVVFGVVLAGAIYGGWRLGL